LQSPKNPPKNLGLFNSLFCAFFGHSSEYNPT
jgi:hypothetical protein